MLGIISTTLFERFQWAVAALAACVVAGDTTSTSLSTNTSDPEIASMWRELESAIARGHPLKLHTGSSNLTRFAMKPAIDCE